MFKDGFLRMYVVNKVSLCAAYRSLGCKQFTGGVHRQEALEEGGGRRVSVVVCVGVSVGVWVWV